MAISIVLLYKKVVLQLTVLYSAEEARAMTDRLFEHYFLLSPTQRVLSGTTLADQENVLLIEDAVGKLLQHIPLQYIIGKALFMDMEFVVNSSVLIPRPETEELVSMIIKQYSGRGSAYKLNILDIGTGSGCIAIALKRFLSASTVSAIDISDDALKVASGNAAANQLEINLFKADILNESQWGTFPEFDLIVSNPPYVTNEEKKQMQLNVLDHEPHTALFVPDDDPLIFYRAIIAFSKIKLRKSGSIWFEINEMFGVELKKLAESLGFKEVNIFFDIRGKSRFLHTIK